MTRLNIEQLRTFVTVVRVGGIGKAAHALHLTQPAITARIKALEASLGAEVFERQSTGMKLTKRGELLLGHAKGLEHLADLIERDVVDPGGIEGHLRIGASETIVQCWLPDFIAELHHRFPRLQIEFNVDVSVNLRDALLDREIDLAILLGPISEYSVENIELPSFEMAWYVTMEPAGLTGTAESLFGKPAITYARNTRPYRELADMIQNRLGLTTPIFPSSSLSACFRLVEAGLGVAALPKRLGASYVAKGTIREFDPGWLPSPLNFTASFLADPKSHMTETAARIAETTARTFHMHKIT